MSRHATLRRPAAAAARTRGFAWLVGALERASRTRPGVLGVLTYHRIAEPDTRERLYPGLISATPSDFEEQMRFLASRYRPLALEELLAVRRGGAPLPARAVLVTVDDGYRDFAEHAWPVLRRQGIPVVLFVPTAFPGNRGRAFWWDRLHAAVMWAGPGRTCPTPDGELRLRSESDRLEASRRLRSGVKSLPHEDAMALVDEVCATLGAPPASSPVLDWDALRRLRSEGVVLAPHTRTHPRLDRLPIETARAEVLGSLEDLEREVGKTQRVFAYPDGGETPSVVRMLAEEGFELGFTTTRGTNDLGHPEWLRLRRINVGRASGVSLLRAQLLHWWPRLSVQKGGSRTSYTLALTRTASKR